MTLTINDLQNRNWYVFTEASIFNNVHIEIVVPSTKKKPNISDSFVIIAKFLFMFCSWITSISYLDMSFLLGRIHVLKNFLDNSSKFSNLSFWERLKGKPSEIIRSTIAIVRQVLSEVINSWEFPSITKTSEPFEKLLELLSDDILDAEEKPEITYEFVSFDEVILF